MMHEELDFFEQLEAERRAQKISRRDARGYLQTSWHSVLGQKFRCHTCKKTFSRMEVLLQHFRDSNRHREDALTEQASKQLADWLTAKDQHKHCCPTCCLGFDTEAELLVHFKHTAVHQNTPEAKQAAAQLLPKDEARFLRRELHSTATPASQAVVSPILQQPNSLKRKSAWQALSAVNVESGSPDRPSKAQKVQATSPTAAILADEVAHAHSSTNPAPKAPAATADSGMQTSGRSAEDVQHSPSAASAAHADNPSSRRHADGCSAVELNKGHHASPSSAAKINRASILGSSPDLPGRKRLLGQPAFVQSLQRRTVFRKPRRRGITNKQVAEESSLAAVGYDAARMSIIETRHDDQLDCI